LPKSGLDPREFFASRASFFGRLDLAIHSE
jgi:hypothetical protein